MSISEAAWSEESLVATANELGRWLIKHPDVMIVLAESCTAGLVSAALAATPGISQSLCGSLVTYRESAKKDWLEIDPQLLNRCSAVSSEVSDALATAALEKTPEATWSLAVTGHLGPNAPIESDGAVFISVARRPALHVVARKEIRLPPTNRTQRQAQAAEAAIRSFLATLAESTLPR